MLANYRRTYLLTVCRRPGWEDRFRVLFDINYEEYATCQTCHTRRPLFTTPTTEIEIHPRNTFDIAIHNFFNDPRDARCDTCNVQNQPHDTRKYIVSGPQILKIRISIFKSVQRMRSNGTFYNHGIKVSHAMPFPEIADLTRYQKVRDLPLRYRLSSVISHSGSVESGHYVATVRGQGNNITCISDRRKETFDIVRMLQSPQRPTITNPKDVYILTYVREDGQLTARQRAMKKMM